MFVVNIAHYLLTAHPLFLAQLLTFTSRFMRCISPPPPLLSRFFHFHAVFRKKRPNNRLIPPPCGLTPSLSGCSWCSQITPSAKSWSCAHARYSRHLRYLPWAQEALFVAKICKMRSPRRGHTGTTLIHFFTHLFVRQWYELFLYTDF